MGRIVFARVAIADWRSTPDEAEVRLRAAEQPAASARRAEADEQLRQAFEFYRSVDAVRYVEECETLLTGTAQSRRWRCVSPSQLFRVPLRVLRKGSCTSKRTEVVRLLVEQQTTNRALWVDRHLADGVDRQVIGILVHANDGENLDRLSDVA